MSEQVVGVGRAARVELLHGYLQRVAELAAVDVLHIKGPAFDAGLIGTSRSSTDADILVRPEHVARLIEALHGLGWRRMTGFAEGSAFGHAENLRHELGMIDVHQYWPGFGVTPDAAFDRLWTTRSTTTLANVGCPVPSVEHQRLILLLHYARSGGARPSDLDAGWLRTSPDQRTRLRELASEFDAELALAAAIGELEQFHSAPEYRLWRHFATGSTHRLDEWWGRWSAARTVPERLRVARAFLTVNEDLLRLELGHDPGAADHLRAYWRRCRTAGRSVATLITTRWHGDQP